MMPWDECRGRAVHGRKTVCRVTPEAAFALVDTRDWHLFGTSAAAAKWHTEIAAAVQAVRTEPRTEIVGKLLRDGRAPTIRIRGEGSPTRNKPGSRRSRPTRLARPFSRRDR